MNVPSIVRRAFCLRAAAVIAAAVMTACANQGSMSSQDGATSSDGPADQGPALPTRQDGDMALGRDVFRNETFGNEGFWTDAVRLPAGIEAAKVTPLQALSLGLQVDVDAIDAATQRALAQQLRDDPTGRTSALLNDPAVTSVLVRAGAIVGMAPKNGKVGATCALCHTMSDASVFVAPGGGSIGHRIDGLANHDLNIGAIFATAANTRALFTVAQLSSKGKTLGRAATGLTENSTEAEFDAYFRNPQNYPVGMFDDTFDGNGNPVHNTPLFRQDLAAPYGSDGLIVKLDNFSNLVYTTLFDQTMLTTPGGRAFVHKLAGAAGDDMIDSYVRVLAATGVRGYPYVTSTKQGKAGEEDNPIQARVDNTKLFALNTYIANLQAPKGAAIDRAVVTSGRAVFAASGCMSCHNVNQGRAVPTTIHAMNRIFPGDNPMTIAVREPPLNPILNTENSIFDDKMVVVNASGRGEKRGIAMPLLLDLARKPVFLHDNSVPSLDELFMARRGANAPHPFYVGNAERRAELVQYLRSLDTGSR